MMKGRWKYDKITTDIRCSLNTASFYVRYLLYVYVRNTRFVWSDSTFNPCIMWSLISNIKFLRPPAVSSPVVEMTTCGGLQQSALASLVTLSEMWLQCFAQSPLNIKQYTLLLVESLVAQEQHHGVARFKVLDQCKDGWQHEVLRGQFTIMF